jgi:hypothetical protein
MVRAGTHCYLGRHFRENFDLFGEVVGVHDKMICEVLKKMWRTVNDTQCNGDEFYLDEGKKGVDGKVGHLGGISSGLRLILNSGTPSYQVLC